MSHGRARVAGLASLGVGAALWMAGCSIERPSRSESELNARRAEFVRQVAEDRVALSRQIVERMDHQLDESKRTGRPQEFDMLVISGGGDWGAFGAGVLKGWGTVTGADHVRPDFDAVTGVSTGALIAPLAFAGTEEAYQRAFLAYQNPKKDWLRERGLLVFLLRKESYGDNSGLVRDVKTTLDDAMLAQIEARAAEHRVLLVGTTNVDQGMLKMWEIGGLAGEAQKDATARRRFFDIVVASTSIPGAFPSVEIDGDLYVDGAVTRNIAYTTDQEFEGSAVSIWRREHPDKPFPKFRIWVIINNQLGNAPRSAQPAWPELLKRSLEIASRSNLTSSLKSLEFAVRAMEKDGLDADFSYIAIPDSWRPPVEGVFKQETMRDLASLGYRLGCDPKSWVHRVPDPESPEVNPEGGPPASAVEAPGAVKQSSGGER